MRSLCERGYGATSVTAVVEGAGSSRGAFLHHFPTKADLMRAVHKRTWDENRRDFLDWFEEVRDPGRRLLGFVEPGWRALSRPAGVAVLEILIACRSDAALDAVIAPAQLEFEADGERILYEHIAGPLGLEDAESAKFFRFMKVTVRGLVAEMMVSRSDVLVDPTLDYVKLVARTLLDRTR